MKSFRKSWSIVVILSLIIVPGLILANYDSAKTEKEKNKPTVKVEYLGSAPMESSLTNLVPEKHQNLILLKERWLDSKVVPRKYPEITVSENGKYRLIGRVPDPKSEGVVEATFIDSNGAEIWNAVVEEDICVSNNGRNIAGVSSFSGRIVFYDVRTSDVRTSTESILAGDFWPKNAFSHNGKYFVSAGSKLIFYRADGTLIWKKHTGTKASKKVAISADGSYIVMASSGGPEPNITEVTGLKEEKQPQYSSPPKSVMDERLDGLEAWKKRAVEKGNKKPPQKVKPLKREKKVYLSFLKRDGTLINQTTIRLRIAQNLAMSREGRYVALSCDSTLLFYQTETGTLLWRKVFPTVYWWMKSMAVSQDGNMIALGVRPDRGDRYSPPYLYLVSKDGSEMGNFQLESPPPRESPPPLHYGWGPIVVFTEDGRHILMATYARKYLFKIAEVDR